VETGANAAPALTSESAAGSGAKPSATTTEVEYEYGRRVEQVISAPGNITRMSVGVIVPGDLSDDKRRRITDLVRMAAGINEARGDAVVVQPLDQLGIAKAAALPVDAAAEGPRNEARVESPVSRTTAPPVRWWLAALLAGAAFAALGALAGLLVGRRVPLRQAPLTALQRQLLLAEMERALTVEAPTHARNSL
jgi:flagellar M-ring protein FliF